VSNDLKCKRACVSVFCIGSRETTKAVQILSIYLWHGVGMRAAVLSYARPSTVALHVATHSGWQRLPANR